MVSIDKIRAQFPALDQKVHGHQLVYLDNGATTHKPKQVIDAIDYYYSIQNSIDRPHNMRVSDFNTLKRSKSFLLKNIMKKIFFSKN